MRAAWVGFEEGDYDGVNGNNQLSAEWRVVRFSGDGVFGLM